MPLWVTWILLPLIVRAQSGDAEETQKEDIKLFCTSHIGVRENSILTCNLVDRKRYIEDDEDEEDSIKSITVCKSFPPSCCKKMGNNMTITWIPLTYNYTFKLRSGVVFSRVIDLRQIIKPKSPSVTSAVFQPESNQAMIYIKTPYDKDFLKTSNQLFQYYIWRAAGSELTRNVTGEESLVIAVEHLTEGTTYQVKVRAIPFDLYGGSWSDWSNTVEFYINSTTKEIGEGSAEFLRQMITVGIVSGILVIAIFCAICVTRKNIHHKIRAYTSYTHVPRIPSTLSPIYKQVKLGFAMTLEPEQFSHMNVQPMKKTEERPGESQAATAEPTAQREDSGFGLDQELSTLGMRWRSASDTSGFTGESASTALSESSEEETYSRPNNRSPSPSMGMHAAEGRRDAPESSGDGQRDASPEVNGPTQPCRDAVYVTMSSFYYHNDQRSQSDSVVTE
ncbi:interleukin-7 receptor subunit alpha isoform X1 [Gadus macrocephalus]|uniref:interleukin-7 receptor subunit alpha isoform X1 n=1 Tax=Gadus macrocephalus TaxID=80720 RepID=UPI0028CB170A|nr:interleukin-7 receptor subunit alpha isoform X1 [Gadus macrocephalus]